MILKKIVVSFVAGVIFATSATAFADDVLDLVGRKVQAVNEIYLKDGSMVGNGIIVNNTTYAPVRAISEAAGFTVELEGKDVILDNQTVVLTTNNTKNEDLSIEDINRAIVFLNSDIASYEKTIQRYTTALNDPNETISKESIQRTIDAATSKLKASQERLADLESQLTELQK